MTGAEARSPSAGPRRRSTRGEHRRQALVTAAAELLVERGIAGVDHRAVAARADLPVAATTHYFASLEHLTHDALVRVTQVWRRSAHGLVARLPERLSTRQAAAAVLEVATARPAEASASRVDGVLAFYERYLEAGRHPGLRPVVRAFNEELLALVEDVLARAGLPADRRTARLALATVDGATVYAVAEGVPPAESAVELLHDLLAALPRAAQP